MMWLLLIFIGLVLAVCLRVKKTMDYWKVRNVPYMKPVPVLGNTSSLVFRKRSFAGHLQHLYNAFPDKSYYGVFQFMAPQLLIRDPEIIKQITVKDFEHFTDRTTPIREDAEPMLARNLAGLKGQKWRDMRATLSASFTSSKMKFLFTLISDCAQQFTTYFKIQGTEKIIDVEVKDAFSRFTNDAIASAAFGITVDSLKDKQNEFFVTGKDFTTFSALRALKFLAYSSFPLLMRLLKVSIFPPAATDFLKRVIRETIQVREERGVVRPDMVHVLLEAQKGRVKHDDEAQADEGFAVAKEASHTEGGPKHQKDMLTEDDIIAQAVIFFFGGFETSSTLLSFLAHELAVNPDVQMKLQNEIDVTQKRFDGKLSYEAVLGMKYLDMVVSEALRKWTPGIGMDRLCVKDYEIEPKVPGDATLTIEKGTSIVIPVIGIHLDPQYFPNPNKFDPERFSDENKGNIVPFTYMPFGSGPRNCIASRFALVEIKILMCHILAQFDIVPTSKTIIPVAFGKKNFSLIPDGGIWLGFKERVKA